MPNYAKLMYAKDAPLEDILAAFQQDGAVIVRDMLSQEMLAALHSDLDNVLESLEAGSQSAHPFIQQFWGANTKRFTRLATRVVVRDAIDARSGAACTFCDPAIFLECAVCFWACSPLLALFLCLL